jgi:hypothetical protein
MTIRDQLSWCRHDTVQVILRLSGSVTMPIVAVLRVQLANIKPRNPTDGEGSVRLTSSLRLLVLLKSKNIFQF